MNASARDAIARSLRSPSRRRGGAGTEFTEQRALDRAIDRAIDAAREALIGLQTEAGYWLFELEADCTIPAEYIMMMHFLDEIDTELQAKIANYLR